jgi:hypothetical protein
VHGAGRQLGGLAPVTEVILRANVKDILTLLDFAHRTPVGAVLLSSISLFQNVARCMWRTTIATVSRKLVPSVRQTAILIEMTFSSSPGELAAWKTVVSAPIAPHPFPPLSLITHFLGLMDREIHFNLGGMQCPLGGGTGRRPWIQTPGFVGWVFVVTGARGRC